MKDLTTGCTIRFTENVYGGNYPNAVYEGKRTIEGLIVKESYGAKTGQHTFTIKVSSADGVEADAVLEKNTIRRKGRNVYPTCTVLAYPQDYERIREEKHVRGNAARERRELNH